jgi:hypothetical protein
MDDDCNTYEILVLASIFTLNQMEMEGRTPSDSVTNNLDAIVKEIHGVVEAYRRRVYPISKKWTLCGVEVPIYWQLRDDVHLSSHIDALFVNDEGRPIIWDWKWREAAGAAMADLSRSPQLACYWAFLASGEGMVKLPEENVAKLDKMFNWAREGDGWTYPPDGTDVPQVAWVDLPSLKPYSRATVGIDDAGRSVRFVKGDDRPLSRVIRNIGFCSANDSVKKIKALALSRADMLLAEEVPAIPQGCSHCECEPWCPRFDMADIVGYDVNNKEVTQ